jgi:hypothetical protein
LDRGEARLYIIGPRGYGERIRFFELIGHGSPYARTIAMYLLNREKLSSLSTEETSVRAYACIKWIADGVDDYVSGEPQVIILKDNDPTVVNADINKANCEKFVQEIKEYLGNFALHG